MLSCKTTGCMDGHPQFLSFYSSLAVTTSLRYDLITVDHCFPAFMMGITPSPFTLLEKHVIAPVSLQSPTGVRYGQAGKKAKASRRTPSGYWPRFRTNASDALPAPTSVHRWPRSKKAPTYHQSSCTERLRHISTSLTPVNLRRRWPYGSAASRSDPEGNNHHKFEKGTRPGPSTAIAKGRNYTERGPVSPGERSVRRRDPGSKPTTGTPTWAWQSNRPNQTPQT